VWPFAEAPPVSSLLKIPFVMCVQFVATTIVFAAIDAFGRREQRAGERRRYLSFLPHYLQPIPRWQSVAGLVVLGTTALWWAAWPFA
jgi:hypothetical protein